MSQKRSIELANESETPTMFETAPTLERAGCGMFCWLVVHVEIFKSELPVEVLLNVNGI